MDNVWPFKIFIIDFFFGMYDISSDFIVFMLFVMSDFYRGGFEVV